MSKALFRSQADDFRRPWLPAVNSLRQFLSVFSVCMTGLRSMSNLSRLDLIVVVWGNAFLIPLQAV